MVRSDIYSKRNVPRGNRFRFTLSIPQHFPQSNQLPVSQFILHTAAAVRITFSALCKFVDFQVIEFEQGIFHPFINEDTRQLELKRFFPQGWKSGTHHIYHSLIFMQRSFYKLDYNSPPSNENAARITTNKFRKIQRKNYGIYQV